jgi:hypothetical protein
MDAPAPGSHNKAGVSYATHGSISDAGEYILIAFIIIFFFLVFINDYFMWRPKVTAWIKKKWGERIAAYWNGRARKKGLYPDVEANRPRGLQRPEGNWI